MKQVISYIATPIIYGLAFAFVIFLVFPQTVSTKNFTPSFRSGPDSYATAVRRAAPAVVNIYSLSITQTPRFMRSEPEQRQELGSGVVMSADGYILTNYHVVNSANQIEVVLQDGRMMQAELIGKDLLTDLALLKINATDLPVIPQKANLRSQVGDVILAMGNPLNLGLTVTQGIVSATEKRFFDSNYVNFIQMDAAINAGNSGGAIVNSEGYLVGISTLAYEAQNENVQGIFFAIPYHTALRIMNQLAQYGRIVRGYLGAQGHPVDALGQRIYTNAAAQGIMLDRIEPFGPASKAGLTVGDIITSVNGDPVTSIAEALYAIETTTPGDQLNLVTVRNGQVIERKVTVEELRLQTPRYRAEN